MRWALLVLVFLSGCNDVPLDPGRVPPAEMDARQWARWVSESGIQADRDVKTFTPSWVGFSSAPSGDISYLDFGEIVVMWSTTDLTGTSNDTAMSFSAIPSAIWPRTIQRRTNSFQVYNSTAVFEGSAVVQPNVVSFYINIVVDDGAGTLYTRPSSTSFHATGTKGVQQGWLIIYAK